MSLNRWTVFAPMILAPVALVACGSPTANVRALRSQDGGTAFTTLIGTLMPGRPVAANGVVLVTEGELCGPGPAVLVALDAQTGSQRWRVHYPSPGRNTLPAATDGVALVTAIDGVRGVAVDSGEERWRQPITANADPVAGHGMVAVPVTRTSRISWGSAETVTALDATTGVPQWSFDLRGGRRLTGMLVSNHGLVLDTWGNKLNGPTRDFIQVDPTTGAERWRADVGVATLHWPAMATGAMLLIPVSVTSLGHPVNVGPQTGVIALDEATGTERWRRVVRENAFDVAGGGALTFVAASNGLVYLRDRADVVALDAATGLERWRRTAPIGSLSAVDGLALIQSADGSITALRALDGDQAWSIRAEPYARIGGAPGMMLVAQGGETGRRCGD